MKKASIIAFFSFLAIVFSAIFGWMIYEIVKLNSINQNSKIAINQTEIIDECTEFAEKQESTIQTMSNEDKISPNALIIFKTYYNGCKHTKQEILEVPKELINLGRQDLQKYYIDWELKGFSNNEIVLYKEINEFCDEHYIIVCKDGKISIYQLNENGEEIWKEDTEVNVDFLPEEDRKKIESGLTIIGRENLNKIIEDFE